MPRRSAWGCRAADEGAVRASLNREGEWPRAAHARAVRRRQACHSVAARSAAEMQLSMQQRQPSAANVGYRARAARAVARECKLKSWVGLRRGVCQTSRAPCAAPVAASDRDGSGPWATTT